MLAESGIPIVEKNVNIRGRLSCSKQCISEVRSLRAQRKTYKASEARVIMRPGG